MTEGDTYTEADLMRLASDAFEASGLTQVAAAEHLGVSQPTIAHAIRSADRSLARLRMQMIEEFTDYALDGPTYTARKK